MAETQRREQLDSLHPPMLRVRGEANPQPLGEREKREIGQCFEWALDQVRMEKKDAAARMGYTDQGVIGRWIAGAERIQMDKVKACLPTVWVEFLLANLQSCDGVSVNTQVTMRRAG